jgi:hypothetical protein
LIVTDAFGAAGAGRGAYAFTLTLVARKTPAILFRSHAEHLEDIG